MIIIVLLLVILIFAIDGLKMIKKKHWKEFTTFSILLAVALLMQILNNLGLPNPINAISKILSPLGKAILRQS